jgi:manganese transport protein
VFDLVRECLGAGMALANLLASFFITLLTLAAGIGGSLWRSSWPPA